MLRQAVTAGLRRPKRANASQSRIAPTRPIQAPTKGWNARDSIAKMQAGYAYRMENWFPTASDVMLRRGSAAHATGLTGLVETLAVYKPEDGGQEMFAFANNEIYDVSSAGAIGAAEVSSLSNNRWITQNMSTSGGSFLICVNGADNMELYDGSSWVTVTGVSTPAITGVSTDDLVYVTVFKERAWYIEADTLSAWYAAAGAFAGALTEFPMQAVFKSGGNLVACGGWSVDGGAGIDDFMVYVSSEGELAIYQGTDPSSASTWALVGVYEVGKPVGRNCLQKLGGDLLIITTDGVFPVSRALIADRNTGAAITDIIQGAMAQAVGLYSAEYGWQLTHFAEGNMLLLNVPNTTASQQFVMNTYTRAWCQFTGWDANCFAEFDGGLYFGGSEVVDQAWTGAADKGMSVRGDLVDAFGDLGDPTAYKELKLMRPTFNWDFAPTSLRIGADIDYVIEEPTSQVTDAGSTGDVWDTGVWDTAIWGGDADIKNEWYDATGIGYAVATHIVVENVEALNFSYLANVFLYEKGGVL